MSSPFPFFSYSDAMSKGQPRDSVEERLPCVHSITDNPRVTEISDEAVERLAKVMDEVLKVEATQNGIKGVTREEKKEAEEILKHDME